MNVNKYTTWQKYIKNSEDKKSSYKIFLYWEKIKNQNVKININFTLNNEQLKESIKMQYVNHKVALLLKRLNKRYTSLEFSEVIIDTLSFYMTPLGINVNKVEQMINGMITSNGVSDRNIPKMIIKSLPKMHHFFKLNSIDNVIDHIKKTSTSTSFRRVGDKFLIQLINNKEELKLYASPSWCTNYNDEQVDHYREKFQTIYIWKKTTSSIEIYGINFNKRLEYIESVFDSNNNEVYDDEMRDTLRLSMGDENYFENLDSIMYNETLVNNHLKTLLLLLNMASDDYLAEVTSQLEYQEITLIMDTLLNRSFPMKERLNKLVKMLIKTDKWESYLLTRLHENRHFSNIIASEVCEYMYNNPQAKLINNSEFINFFMKSISMNDQYKIFNKLNTKNIVDVNDSIYTLCFFDFLDNKQKSKLINKIPNYTNAEIFDVINYCGEVFLDSKQLVRLLIKHNKLNLNMISAETYEIIRNSLDLTLKIKLFKGTPKITVAIANSLLKDSAIPIKEITSYWIQKKRINFENANTIGFKNLNMQSLNKRYSEDDFYDDTTTSQYDFKLNYLKLYYKNRYWMKSNENYLDKMILLLKTNQITENEFSKLLITSNEGLYERDVQLMFVIASEENLNIGIKNKYSILNALKHKSPREDQPSNYYMIFFTKFVIINDLLHKNKIKATEIHKYIKEEEILNYFNDYSEDSEKIKTLHYKLLEFVFKTKINNALSKKQSEKMWFLYLQLLEGKISDSKTIKKFFLRERLNYVRTFGTLLDKCVVLFGNYKF